MIRVRSPAWLVVVAVAALLADAGCSATPAAHATPAGPQLELTGNLATHDPSIVAGTDGSPWYVFSTGESGVGDGNIQIRTSPDGHAWTDAGTVWDTKPAWLVKKVPGVDNLWAPEVYHHGGTYYLYYAASTFGSNESVIGLATNTTLDPKDPSYRWVDQGEVEGSSASDDFNAIDPAIVQDADGTPWMAFGSFWSGIKMVQLAWPSGKRADSATPLSIADRQAPPDAIEGSTVIPHDGMYYLVVSRDLCCRGTASTYNMAVGRSKSVQGPYVDKDGKSLLDDGGTPLLASEGNQVGPGGESYSNGYLAWHYYDATQSGQVHLAIEQLGWDADDWPTLHVTG